MVSPLQTVVSCRDLLLRCRSEGVAKKALDPGAWVYARTFCFMTMRISHEPDHWEDDLSSETRAELAYLRNQPTVSREEDPNDWLSLILEHLRRSPEDRLDRWAGFVNSVLRLEMRGGKNAGFSPRQVLQAFTDCRVVFVLVGMGAAYLQGVPYPTYNTDITPMPDRDNMERANNAVRALGSGPSTGRQRTKELSTDPIRRFGTAAGSVNLVPALPDVGGYDKLRQQANRLDLGTGLAVWAAALRGCDSQQRSIGPVSRRCACSHVPRDHEGAEEMR